MTRTRIGLALATAVLGGAGVLGLTACSPATDNIAASAEGRALAAMGYATELETDDPGAEDGAPGVLNAPADKASDGPGGKPAGAGKHKAARVMLNRHVLHGEATVETKDGVKVVSVQRGTVTAIDGKTVTVKSSDGYTQTWTIGSPIHVRAHKKPAEIGAVTVGAEVGVAGTKDGGTTTARLIVIPEKQK